MLEQISDFENLLRAFKKAAKGKRGRTSVAAFEYALEENLLTLQQDLRNRTYKPGKYRSFYIHEPKKRLISAAPFCDRVVHHALCNVIEPAFERSFIKDSYANRIGKGTHRALDRCQQFSRKYNYCLQCDIKQFFPSLDQEILYGLIQSKISDAGTLWLVSQILASGAGVLGEVYDMVYFAGDTLFAANRARGLPIGNLTSQFWANVFMSPFDHFVKRELRCLAYLRYVDDFLLFSNTKEELWFWKKQIAKRLAGFRLTMHAHAHPRPVTEGIPFLGFVVYPQRRALKRRKGIYFQRKYKKMRQQFHDGEIPLKQLNDSVRGWINHTRYGNTVGLRKAILG